MLRYEKEEAYFVPIGGYLIKLRSVESVIVRTVIVLLPLSFFTRPMSFSIDRRVALLRLSAIALLSAGCSSVQRGRSAIQQGVRSLRGSVLLGEASLKKGELISDGVPISTGKGGRLIVVREQNAYLLREESLLTFQKNGQGHSDLLLEHGAVLSVFAPGRVTIRTPVAHIGIRGTGCYVEANREKSYICLCYGEGDIYSSITDELLMKVNTHHHDSPFNIYPEGELMVPMPTINHTDEELVLLENLVGRTPPFVDDKWEGRSNY